MAKEDTKRAMSEAAKDANAMRKLKSVGMGEKEFAAMKAKYGARAYDLISAAMFPGNVVKALGWEKFKKSSATIKEFIDKPLTPEQVEKVTGKKADNTRTQATSLKSNSRDDTKATMKQQRAASDKATQEATAKKKAADEKKRAEAEAKKKTEAERKVTQEKAKKTNAPAPKSIDTSTTQVSDTLRCQIEQQNVNGLIRFKSSVTDLQGVTIPELPGATNDSLWDVTFDREADVKNPVGGGTRFLGAMQYDDVGVKNIALYALTKPEYKNIAQKFFNPGYEKALKDFQEYVKKEGNNKAYWQTPKEKTELLKYLKKTNREYRTIFRNEGKINAPQFLQLQRDFASDVYLAQTKGKYKRIVEALKKHNMKPENLDPKIWSMVFASAIHQKTYLNSIARVFETMQYTTYVKGKKVVKNIKNLNSVEMIDAIAAVDSSTFGSGSGKKAYEKARKDFGKKHSATTSRELSIILDDPQILKDYEQLMAQNVTKVNGKYYAKANAPTKTASNNVRTNNTARM